MRNLINFESQTQTDCFLHQSRDGARVGDGKRHLPASPINTPLISRASPAIYIIIARHAKCVIELSRALNEVVLFDSNAYNS